MCFCHFPWNIFFAFETLDSGGDSGLSDLDFDSLVRAAVVVEPVLSAADGLTVFAAAAAAVIDVVVERTTLLVVDGLETVLSTAAFSTVGFSAAAFSSGSEMCNNHPKAITDVQRKENETKNMKQ